MSDRPGAPPERHERPPEPRHAGGSLTDELLSDILDELRDINSKLADPPAPTGKRVRIQEPAPGAEK